MTICVPNISFFSKELTTKLMGTIKKVTEITNTERQLSTQVPVPAL